MKKLEKQKSTTQPLVNEKAVKEILSKGAPPKKDMPDPDQPSFKQINIKITNEEHKRVEILRESMPKERGKRMAITLHDWIIKAIQEKLERDENQNN